MRDDLLYAQESVNWAVAKLPSFGERLQGWLRANVDVVIRDQEPPATGKIVLAVEKEILPLGFNVEAGSYLNVIRSSLDILATSLAHRYRMSNPDDAHFPMAKSETAFIAGNYKGHKFVKDLPLAERRLIEGLKPYKGGNAMLWDLHHLDIVRKHRRLLNVRSMAPRVSVAGYGLKQEHIVFPAIMGVGTNGETVLAFVSDDAPECKFHPTMEVILDEPAGLLGIPIVTALSEFARLADSIITLFDDM